jgi:5-methylcytosine-specific restriction endonuclease McrA
LVRRVDAIHDLSEVGPARRGSNLPWTPTNASVSHPVLPPILDPRTAACGWSACLPAQPQASDYCAAREVHSPIRPPRVSREAGASHSAASGTVTPPRVDRRSARPTRCQDMRPCQSSSPPTWPRNLRRATDSIRSMPSGRPAIPRGIDRAVRLEAGHRCAIPTCRATAGLQIHHIKPYARVKAHEFANVILVRSNCHSRITNGEIDRPVSSSLQSKLGHRKRSVRRPGTPSTRAFCPKSGRTRSRD